MPCHFKWNRFNRIPGMSIVYCDMWTHFSFICSKFLIQWLKDFFLGGGRFFFDILAFESDLLLKDLRTFSQNLKQLWIVLIHVNIVFHSSWLCLGILAWGKCYHCQLDSNFMPTAQLYKFPKTQMLLVDTRRYISNNYILKWLFCCLLLDLTDLTFNLIIFGLFTFLSVIKRFLSHLKL